MKKYIALLTVLVMLFSFAACKDSGESATSDEYPLGTVVGEEIEWSEDKADASIVGAWQLVDDKYDEYYIFTDDCKVMVVKGSVSYVGTAAYGVDSDGIRSFFSEFEYLYGQLTYTVEGDTLTFLALDGTEQVLKRAEYILPELDPYDDFKVDSKLTGIWYNNEYMDSYEFYDDGYAKYSINNNETYGWTAECQYSYRVSDGKITLKSYDGEDYREEKFDYSVDGDVLTINDQEYSRVYIGNEDTAPATTVAE